MRVYVFTLFDVVELDVDVLCVLKKGIILAPIC